MSKRKKLYKLNVFVKAVEELARRKGFIVRAHEGKKGSAVAFEVFATATQTIPDKVWTVHTAHTRKREIWSPEDYRKPCDNLGGTHEEFEEILSSI